MASIQADPSFEGNLNRYMDFDFAIACLFYLTWRRNILISLKDYRLSKLFDNRTRVFHGPICNFNFVQVQSFSVPSSCSENYNCLRNASKYFTFIFLWRLSVIIFFQAQCKWWTVEESYAYGSAEERKTLRSVYCVTG